MAKLCEYLIKGRLECNLQRDIQLSGRQFDCRKGRSTVDAINFVAERFREIRNGFCLLVTFDVRNAFNTVSWNVIMDNVKRKVGEGATVEILKSYLSERSIIFEARSIMVKSMEYHKHRFLFPSSGTWPIMTCYPIDAYRLRMLMIWPWLLVLKRQI